MILLDNLFLTVFLAMFFLAWILFFTPEFRQNCRAVFLKTPESHYWQAFQHFDKIVELRQNCRMAIFAIFWKFKILNLAFKNIVTRLQNHSSWQLSQKVQNFELSYSNHWMPYVRRLWWFIFLNTYRKYMMDNAECLKRSKLTKFKRC